MSFNGIMNKVMVSKFNSLWKLMSEQPFILDPDTIHEDLSCMLCQKLMIDACQTPCTCQYCYKCISAYLSNGDKYCPGNKSECKLEFLVMERDILRDPKTNNKILRSKVICPNLCQSKIELSKVEEHMASCGKQSTEGLSSVRAALQLDNVAVLEYLHTAIYTHTESIMNNIKNEFDAFKETLERNRIEIESLKESMRIKDIQLREVENMKIDLRNKDNKIVMLERKLEDVQRERMADKNMLVSNLSSVKQELYEQIGNQEDDLKEMCNTIAYKVNNLDRRMIYYSNWNQICPNSDEDFVWKIHNLSKINGEIIFSDPFYFNDYKFCMCFERHCDKIALWCYIMMGNDDSVLRWPMQEKVTLAVFNQDTMRPHKSLSFQYDNYFYKYQWIFHRPVNFQNDSGIGSYSFILYSSIQNDPSVVVNDSVVVSCIINETMTSGHE